jgi:superfamily II DNA or RNA helicase
MSASILPLRDYQRDTIRKLHTRWDAGDARVPCVLATGLGKTVIFAHLIREWLDDHPFNRALVLVHTDELALQAERKMREVAPHLTVGIVKAERNEITSRVIIGSVQTLRNAKRRAQLRRVGLIVVDECHHAVATTYRSILDHFEGPDVQVAGFTATLARGDKLKLSEVWAAPAVTYGISFGIRRGYLLDVRGKHIVIQDFDLGNVKKIGGDYADGALADELDRSLAPEKIAEAYLEHAGDRKGIAFWPTVESAQHGEEAFEKQGIRSETIHGKLGREERRAMLRRLASGETQVVHGVAVLTEGFDDPTISCVVLARPTRSAPLYQQMVGRGLRPDLSLPSGERGDCLVLDVVGASRSHDLRSLVDLSEREISDEIGMDEELSLLDMEEMQEQEEQRLAEEGGWPEPAPYFGDTESIDFDPLGRTTPGAWLQTGQGHYFLPVNRDAYVLLAPSEEPGHFDVAWLPVRATLRFFRDCAGSDPYFAAQCRCGGHHAGEVGGYTEHRELSLEAACSWAEEVMEELTGVQGGGVLGKAKARWRKDDPTVPQKQWASRNGIDWSELTKGEISDLRNMSEATARIDPVVSFLLASRVQG